MSGLVGWMTMRAIRPVESRPMCCQLRPASVERYTPLPSAVIERMKNVSPVPAHTTLCADGADAGHGRRPRYEGEEVDEFPLRMARDGAGREGCRRLPPGLPTVLWCDT